MKAIFSAQIETLGEGFEASVRRLVIEQMSRQRHAFGCRMVTREVLRRQTGLTFNIDITIMSSEQNLLRVLGMVIGTMASQASGKEMHILSAGEKIGLIDSTNKADAPGQISFSAERVFERSMRLSPAPSGMRLGSNPSVQQLKVFFQEITGIEPEGIVRKTGDSYQLKDKSGIIFVMMPMVAGWAIQARIKRGEDKIWATAEDSSHFNAALVLDTLLDDDVGFLYVEIEKSGEVVRKKFRTKDGIVRFHSRKARGSVKAETVLEFVDLGQIRSYHRIDEPAGFVELASLPF